jgi:hypothetical protein
MHDRESLSWSAETTSDRTDAVARQAHDACHVNRKWKIVNGGCKRES